MNDLAFKLLTATSELNPQTQNLVLEFATAMADKLKKAEEKYGYTNNWKHDEWSREDCTMQFLRHVAKGDPIDVACYCAFMKERGWQTSFEGLDDLLRQVVWK